MELTITQPVFTWIFGTVGVLLAIILVLAVVVLGYVVALLRLANQKSKEVAATVDTVREVVEESAESFNDTRRHIASVVGAAMNANMIGNLVRTVRSAWQNHHPQEAHRNESDDIFGDITMNTNKKKGARHG